MVPNLCKSPEPPPSKADPAGQANPLVAGDFAMIYHHFMNGCLYTPHLAGEMG